MVQTDCENAKKRYMEEADWCRELFLSQVQMDKIKSTEIINALMRSFNRLYERYGIRPNAFVVSREFIERLLRTGDIERDYRTGKLIFHSIPVYETHELNVITAVIRLEE